MVHPEQSDRFTGVNEPNHPGFVDAIASAIADRLTPTDSHDLEVVAVASYPHYAGLIQARKLVSIGTGLLLVYAIANSFTPLWPPAIEFPLRFTVALCVIASGLGLIITLIVELFQGAGCDQEIQLRDQGQIIREYNFIPSLNQFTVVLLLLALGLLTIIFGFANFYSELVRQDPNHFQGLEAGFLAIYFSLVTFSTVGYGDIHPASVVARLAAVGEIFTAMFFSLVVISTTLSWVIAHKRQEHELAIKQRIRDRTIKPSHPVSP
ncbi:potassium channel family protein [Spirulina major]|uniref:potassium channel family protein n=1 Tax=Spirulina major TaxID=270636 RepID=UPI0009336D10|nr:potassium channel family protein [Spirulina major]